MIGVDDDPFGCVVRMVFVEVAFERGRVLGEEFEGEAKFLGAFVFFLPSIVRDDRAIDLHAGGEAGGDGTGGKEVGIGALGDGGPSEVERGRDGWSRHGDELRRWSGANEAVPGEIDP